MDSDQRLARLLNQAGNLGLQDDEALRSVITDYFCYPDSDGVDSDGDDEETQNEISSSDSESDDEEYDHHQESTPITVLQKAATLFECDQHDPKPSTCHCKCKLFEGRSCLEQFTKEESISIRLNIKEMSAYEKDLLLLGMISASCNASNTTLCSRQKNADRKNSRIRAFCYGHHRICRETFMFLMAISKDKLTALKKHYLEHGLIPKTKKSGGRQKTALSMADIEQVAKFIQNYAELHSLVLPGRVPGFKRDDVKILPSSNTKASIWRLYKDSAVEGDRTVSLTTFRNFWRQLFPYIVVAKPMTDLCWVCQRNNARIIQSVNISEEEKSDVLRQQEEHLRLATLERSHYNEMVSHSHHIANQHNLSQLVRTPPQTLPATFHYSFDFAQQVQYPADPMQPGPIFFKVPRRCGIFGVMAEGLKQQVNYLIDEGMSVGKGANTVISLLHHFFDHYGAGETHVTLNADNCAGQNKNAAMMWYLAWRVATGRHTSASISFMMAGHTKFAPDWCFGLLKRKYRRSKVSSLEEIANAVTSSSHQGVNRVEVVGTESGEVRVKMYDWTGFFSPSCKKLPGMKKMHHFTCSSEQPGIVVMKPSADGDIQKATICAGPFPSGMPKHIPPPGLSQQRQEYLFKEIRPFCSPETADTVCPEPCDRPPKRPRRA